MSKKPAPKPKTLYNTDSVPVVPSRGIDEPAVQPGAPYEFTPEEIEAGISGSWSEEDPRRGLGDEERFKATRDAAADAEASQDPDAGGTGDPPAEPETTKE